MPPQTHEGPRIKYHSDAPNTMINSTRSISNVNHIAIGNHARLEKGTFIAERSSPGIASDTVGHGILHELLSEFGPFPHYFHSVSCSFFSVFFNNYLRIIAILLYDNNTHPLKSGIMCYKIREIEKGAPIALISHWCFKSQVLHLTNFNI